MARYILIDNHSGFVWADTADLSADAQSKITSAVEAAQMLDEKIIGTYGRAYEAVGFHSLASNEGGYHVYHLDAAAAFSTDYDGRDSATIAALQRVGEHAASVRYTDVEASVGDEW